MRYLVYPFWNSSQRRPRALWRIVLFLLVMSLLMFALIFILPPFRYEVSPFVEVVSILLAAWASAWLWDRRPFADYGFHFNSQWWRDFGFGLMLGALLMTGIFLVEWMAGWVEVVDTIHEGVLPGAFLPSWVFFLMTFVAVGISEELLTRGYLIRNLAEGLNMPPLYEKYAVLLAWLITAVVFGLLHLGNPHMNTLSTANLIVAGLFLGLGYIMTGELAIPIGLHISWNFFQGNVFGFPVSGISRFRQVTLIATKQHGPELWTGGAFGPEGGLLSLVAMMGGSVLILLWLRHHNGHLHLATNIATYPHTSAKVPAAESPAKA